MHAVDPPNYTTLSMIYIYLVIPLFTVRFFLDKLKKRHNQIDEA